MTLVHCSAIWPTRWWRKPSSDRSSRVAMIRCVVDAPMTNKWASAEAVCKQGDMLGNFLPPPPAANEIACPRRHPFLPALPFATQGLLLRLCSGQRSRQLLRAGLPRDTALRRLARDRGARQKAGQMRRRLPAPSRCAITPGRLSRLRMRCARWLRFIRMRHAALMQQADELRRPVEFLRLRLASPKKTTTK